MDEKLENKLQDVKVNDDDDGDDAQLRKAVKARANHHLVYEGMLYRRPYVHTRTSILIGMHDEIRHSDFKTSYRMIGDRL